MSTEASPTTHVVSSVLNLADASYNWAKEFTVAQVPIVATPLDSVEKAVMNTTTNILKKRNLSSKDLISACDDKVFSVLSHYEVEDKLNAVKLSAAKRVAVLKGENENEVSADVTTAELLQDTKELAWDQVAVVNDKVDKAISNVEDYVDTALPAEDDEEEEDKAENPQSGMITKQTRLKAVAMTVSRRSYRKAMAKVASTSLKLRENPMVHVDLVRYSELLDVNAIKERVMQTKDEALAAVKSKAPETFDYVEGVVVQSSKKASSALANAKVYTETKIYTPAKEFYTVANVYTDTKIYTPAKEFYTVAVAEFLKRAKTTEETLRAKGSEFTASALSAKEFTTAYVEAVKNALGATWQDKLYTPTMDILEECKIVYAEAAHAYANGVECPSVEREDGTPYTVEAGYMAFLTALGLRLSHEWTVRVQPAILTLPGADKAISAVEAVRAKVSGKTA